MNTKDFSVCFSTDEVEACRAFYKKHFMAYETFDCGWYITLRMDYSGPEISFMQPQNGEPAFSGTGTMLNFKVDDVDAEYERLVNSGVPTAMPLEDHPWGDRGFSVLDPIGNSVYIYSEREPSEEFRKYILEK